MTAAPMARSSALPTTCRFRRRTCRGSACGASSPGVRCLQRGRPNAASCSAAMIGPASCWRRRCGPMSTASRSLPGGAVAIFTCNDEGWASAADLARAGIPVAAIIDSRRDALGLPRACRERARHRRRRGDRDRAGAFAALDRGQEPGWRADDRGRCARRFRRLESQRASDLPPGRPAAVGRGDRGVRPGAAAEGNDGRRCSEWDDDAGGVPRRRSEGGSARGSGSRPQSAPARARRAPTTSPSR